MKTINLILLLLISIYGFSQKDGKYLTEDDPVNNLWEYDGEEYEEGAPMAGMGQRFFFLLAGGSGDCMMAPFEMDGGFACPNHFKVSKDSKYLYIDLLDTCQVDYPEDERYFKVEYELDEKNMVLYLIVDGEKYRYLKWNP